MLSTRAILSVKFTPAGPKASRAVGGFLRYVHYRDQHEVGERAEGAGGLVRYVAYRDGASPQGRLFDANGTIGDRERKRLVEFVKRSLRAPEPVSGKRRAVYRMVLSPEDACRRGVRLSTATPLIRTSTSSWPPTGRFPLATSAGSSSARRAWAE